MPESQTTLTLTGRERAELERARTRSRDPLLRQRITALLLLAAGETLGRTADHIGVTSFTVEIWVGRYLQERTPAALRAAGRRRPRTHTWNRGRTRELIRAALRESPHAFGYPDESWNSRLLRSHLLLSAGVKVPIPVLERLIEGRG